MKNKRSLILINIVILTVVAVVLTIIVWPTSNVTASGVPTSMPYFSEFMSSNDSAVMDEDGEYPRWVEIHNPGNAPLSLSGYGLSDRSDELKWRFPNVTVPADSYIVVYLSKKNRVDPKGNLHTGYGLSKDETLSLINPEGSIIDTFPFMTLSGNTSAIRKLGQSPEWVATGEYTPGLPNTPEAHLTYLDSRRADPVESAIVLNEISPVNRTRAPDEDGDFPDWIELHNASSSPVELSGFALSDRADKPLQWRFPEGVIIEPQGYLVVYCSNKNRVDPAKPLHTNFSISSAATTITLVNSAGQLLDEVLVQDIPDDATWARDPGGDAWSIHREPTPGLPNTAESRLSVQRTLMEQNPGLYVSQVVSRNKGSAAYDEETPDWIELFNATASPINLKDYGLSDDPSRPLLWRFPDAVIGAGSTLLVYADGQDGTAPGEGGASIHAAFRLDRLGETLVLATPERQVIDRVVLPALDADIAYVRVAGRDGFFYCDDPKPGAAPKTVYDGLLAPPALSSPGGIYAGAVSVTAQGEDGATLHYTLDGSEPTQSSPQLTGAVPFDKPGVLRVRAYRSGYIPSAIATASYLVGVSHEVPVISLVSDPDGLFSYEHGIFEKGPGYDKNLPVDKPHLGANYYKGWERAASFEFFDANGVLEYEQTLGIKIHGAFSREREQKSFSVNARSMYGDSRIHYNPFDNRDYPQYKNFVLRTTSQDDNRARMRDAVLTDAMAEGTGVAYQAAKPVALYINGAYWGHYDLRERVNHHMVANFEGITDPEEVARINVIEGNSKVNNGSNAGWKEIMTYLENNRLTRAENLAWIDERIDIENYFNYVIMEMWCANSDTGNIRFYQVPGGKWKWILYDLDWAMNTHNEVEKSDMCGKHWDTITWYTKEKGHGSGAGFSTLLIRRLLEVDALREQFVQQMAHLLNTNLSTQHVTQKIDAYAAVLAPEMPQHYERWGYSGSVSSWEKHVQRLRDWTKDRNGKMVTDMKNYFDLSSARISELFPNGTP